MNHTPLVDAAVFAALAAASALVDPLSQGVYEDREMIYLVILGAILGGYLATTLFSKADATRRQLASRLGASSIASVCFSPWLMEEMGIHFTRGKVLGFSAAVAVIGVPVIIGVANGWTKFFINRFSPPDGEFPRRGYQSPPTPPLDKKP